MRKFPILITITSMVLSGLATSPAQADILACGGAGIFTVVDGEVTEASDTCSGVVSIPEGVTSIAFSVFEGLAITELEIPASLVGTDLSRVFDRNRDLERITVASGNPNFSSDSAGVLFDKNKTTVLLYPQGKNDSSYAIPSGVTRIGNSAFDSARFTSVEIPDTVTSIGISAFISSSLTSVSIPASATTIEYYAFRNNSDLSLITFAGDPTGPADEDYVFQQVTATVQFPVEKLTAWTAKLEEYNRHASLTADPRAIVTFDSNGGVGSAPGAQSTSSAAFVPPSNTATKAGYVFAGWNTQENGLGVTYNVGSTYSITTNLDLYAKWTRSLVRATANVKPSVSGKAISTSKGNYRLTAKKGTWTGYPTPVTSYRWYLCTSPVKAATSTIPKTCKAIHSATKYTLAVTSSFKGKYLAVAITGKGAGTIATKWLSKSTSKVK